MRLLPLALLFLASSCHDASRIDEIYIRKSGWSAADITVTRNKGRYEISNYPQNRTGSFSFTPEQFSALQEQLEPFRRQSVAFSDKSVRHFIEGAPCPEGAPYVTDSGGVYIRWKGQGLDEHYLADLQCDYKRNAARNTELFKIVKSFPVPLKW